MTAVLLWPDGISYKPLRDSWSAKPYLPPIKSEMDGGNVRYRKRPGDDVRTIQQAIAVDRADYFTVLEPFLVSCVGYRVLMPVFLGDGFHPCIVQITDPNVSPMGPSHFRVTMELRVLRTVTALQIAGSPVTTATQNVAYLGFQVAATGGVPGYTFSVSSGALPTGISLNADTGVVSGTPTVTGTFSNIVIRVTDNSGTTADLAPFTLTVS